MQSVADRPVGVQLESDRVYDTSYIPPSLGDKVDANHDTIVDKNVKVNQLMINGKFVYRITKDGVINYYDTHGVEVRPTGAM